ncbi:hypothetical protein OU994_16720 [Pseudoduganella sp. SL102]|uniref:hypothetical protein n=1 Tax=Pseudoduganella sp. SL102 TaxID=2995154 RepID=UPI00248C380F|nr:hypothetical protein [Pseudoduganella sp. SL102]WBR99967.1 hypothetical protein OU994_16720 [Pseudoduganella sp. SL102]
MPIDADWYRMATATQPAMPVFPMRRATVQRPGAAFRAKVVRYSMREHSSIPPGPQEPPEPAEPAAPPGTSATRADAAAAPGSPADLPPSGFATGAGHPDFALPETAASAEDAPAARWRQRLPWILLGMLFLAIAAATPSLVRKWQADQALYKLARMAPLPAPAVPPPATGSVPAQSGLQAAGAPPALPAGDPNAAGAPANAVAPSTAVLPVSTPGTPTRAVGAGAAIAGPPVGASADVAVAGASAGVPGKPGQEQAASITAAQPIVPAPPVPPNADGKAASLASAGPAAGSASVAEAQGKADTVKDAAPEPRKRNRASRAAKRKAAPERRAVAKNTARSTGTFRRCPPLGTRGAVMCRWHICNGGAGKEAACRPYLERRP